MTAFGQNDNSDHDEYIWFTGKARLSRDMHILHGYVVGMAADGKINDLELKNLNSWLGEHKEFADHHPFNEVIPRIQKIIFDGIVDEEERADLIWLCNKFKTEDGYYDDVTSDMQRLHGILAGIISDGRINKSELRSLAAWIEDRTFLRCCWPYDRINALITRVMRDGRIDPQEHEALLQRFGEFVSAGERKAVGVIERDVTVSCVCEMAPTLEIENRLFCFTGSSIRGPRTYLASVVAGLGGHFHRSLRADTDYLVVGAEGNPCWAFACYGRKVEDAIERRRNGQQISIVHEIDFWSVVDSIGDSSKVSKRTR